MSTTRGEPQTTDVSETQGHPSAGSTILLTRCPLPGVSLRGQRNVRNVDIDTDLGQLGREELIAEVRRLRAGIRAHRDSSGHDLCWHHPQLWGLLPERVEPEVAVPPWPRFIRGCVAYRESLDNELPHARVHDREFES